MRVSPAIAATQPPPILEAIRWTDGLSFSAERPLLNLSQAAPVDPPPEAMRREMARLVMEDPSVHSYGPDLGLPALRDAIASSWSAAYGGAIAGEQVAVTTGCNQAFCAAIAAVAEAGDKVILPTPYYFNHAMHLQTAGIEAAYLPCDDALLPDLQAAERIIDPRTRAIVLVTPNNPTGAEYPPASIRAFFDLAKSRGIALILDETYRDFLSSEARPHELFSLPDWDETLIHLYSFSKTYRITGHRIGAMIASTSILAQVEKYIDSVTICPAQLGQRAALYGLTHLGDWVEDNRKEILRRKAAIERVFAGCNRSRILSCGAYFAFAAFDHPLKARRFAEHLVGSHGILCLPGSMFTPDQAPFSDLGARTLRIAFANADLDGIAAFGRRWADFWNAQ